MANTAKSLRRLIREQDWGAVADMIRPYCKGHTRSGIDTDDLADWLQEGAWPEVDTDTDTFHKPEQVAAEWNEAFDHAS